MPSISLERAYRIWNDDTGDYIHISDDEDGLDMMKISTVANLSGGKEETHTVYITPEFFDLFVEAVKDYVLRKKVVNSDYSSEVYG
jgi:hypothetical protein